MELRASGLVAGSSCVPNVQMFYNLRLLASKRVEELGAKHKCQNMCDQLQCIRIF